MAFVEMEQAAVLAALSEYEDDITSEHKSLEAFYRQFSCPSCGGGCQKEYNPKHAFSDPDTLVGRALLRCIDCACLFDPFSGLRLEMGNKGKVRPKIPLIYPNDG